MTPLRQKMTDSMRLRGLSVRTIKNYISEVKNFARYFKKSPEFLGDDEIRRYLLYLVDRRYSFSKINVAFSALRYLYMKVLDRPWSQSIPPMQREKRLPVSMTRETALRIIEAADSLKHRNILQLCYSSGLRISEAVNLKVADIDGARRSIRIRQGKGKKDRCVLLSEKALIDLREYWKKYRPSDYLFPGRNNRQPISARRIQDSFQKARIRAGIEARYTVHHLRHSFATHLVEQGVNLMLIKELLGHSSIKTTMVYLHPQTYALLNVKSPLDIGS